MSKYTFVVELIASITSGNPMKIATVLNLKQLMAILYSSYIIWMCTKSRAAHILGFAFARVLTIPLRIFQNQNMFITANTGGTTSKV